MRTRSLLAAVVLTCPALAVEPWADPALKTTQGLIVWLDAGRQPALPTGGLVDVVRDGSGQGLHLAQRVREAQPRLVRAENRAVFRFDGKDDHLGRTGGRRELDKFTLFIHSRPRSNAGFFRGLFAVNESGKNDYTTGFNLDLGGEASADFSRVNVEGKGFGGAVNLLRTARPFGGFHTIAVTCEPGQEGVRLFLDGAAEGTRPRTAGVLRMDDLSLGARCYSNTPEPPCMTGFLDGDVAELLLFERVLPAEERKAVEAYLSAKHAGLGEALRGDPDAVALKTVKDPPAVQVLVPGFRVKQLPITLPNVNNARYRADGKLIALAYDGNVHVLSDTDGDGLEDRAELFWENRGQLRGPIGMALTPPGYRHGQGVFVASKGKVSLLVDSKNTGKADREIVVAQGWKESTQAVDALGVALDREGNVYFGLGCADYTNAYQIDREGRARYDLRSERGTILKVSPDFQKREVIATGIRFPVGLAFDAKGELFATDQEGATWLPNGNPFDELLHIQPGRHYGFPPRHPKHLPSVLDQPSVFDYGPQHQSTCGLTFNEPVNGGPIFGPASWRGNALVAGYSRGKLYRTALVPTRNGPVAHTQLVACLNQLTVDSTVSPKGELVVAVHSGAPDWGSGPTGKGKLYKIVPEAKAPPRPILAWPAGPGEVRVAFDQPLDPQALKGLTRAAVLEYGEHVRAGDRFEVLRPGYAVVQQQTASPRYRLPILSSAVSADRRTLVLATPIQRKSHPHALTLPGWGRGAAGPGEQPQHAAIDLDYDLSGVEAVWQPLDGLAERTWLPSLDLKVARALTRGSGEHERFFKALERPGRLTLRTRLALDDLTTPAVQPGSRLDHLPPPEKPELYFLSENLFSVRINGGDAVACRHHNVGLPLKVLDRKLAPQRGEPVAVEVVLTREVEETRETWLETTLSPIESVPGSAGPVWTIPLRRFLLPWTEAGKASTAAARSEPELEGGDWTRGRRLFFSDDAQCAKCHTVHGEGARIGPDLSNLVHRDYASVYRDVVDPSAAINPDHLSYTIELKSGRIINGVMRSLPDGRLAIADNAGRETVIRPGDIEDLVPAQVSIMPVGIDRVLGKERLRDLLTFLLTEPLQAAPLERAGAPPPRSRAEVEKVLKTAERPTKPGRKVRIVLSSGPKDHGPGEHDYPLWGRRWYNLLSLAENVSVETVSGWPTPKQFETADVIVFYSNNPGWGAERAAQLEAYQKRGGGLVYLHYAVDGHRDGEALAKRIGLAWRGGFSRFRHGELEVAFPKREHPITRGFEKVRFVDESYWNLIGEVGRINVLGTGVEDGKERPLFWTHEAEKGRVFVSILGHYSWTFDDPLFRVLILRGIAWAAREPADRWLDLATIGARLGD